jgi:hypothetical protein
LPFEIEDMAAALDRVARMETPAAHVALPRYDQNPQLAIIETYVLDVLGELSREEIEETADAVMGLFGECRDWRHCVRKNLGWNPLTDYVIAENWCRYRTATREAGCEPDPSDFARSFADQVVRLSWT